MSGQVASKRCEAETPWGLAAGGAPMQRLVPCQCSPGIWTRQARQARQAGRATRSAQQPAPSTHLAPGASLLRKASSGFLASSCLHSLATATALLL